MAFRALEAMQRLDALISRPIQRMQLPAMLEDALAYPDGECLFGKDTAFTTCWVSCALAQCVWPGAMAPGLSCTMSSYLAMVLGKFAFPRQRPGPDSVGLAPRTASGLAARSRFADAPDPRPQKRQAPHPQGTGHAPPGIDAPRRARVGSAEPAPRELSRPRPAPRRAGAAAGALRPLCQEEAEEEGRQEGDATLDARVSVCLLLGSSLSSRADPDASEVGRRPTSTAISTTPTRPTARRRRTSASRTNSSKASNRRRPPSRTSICLRHRRLFGPASRLVVSVGRVSPLPGPS